MNLVICGNGFDLHHDLNTSYSAYEKHLRDHAPYVFKKFNSFPWLNAECSEEHWKDVEKTLDINFDGMCSRLSEYITDCQKGDEQALIELQTDLEDWTRFIYSFTGEEFYKWLTTADVSKVNTDHSIVDVIADSICVNFNYTDILESIYGVSSDRILHIHGELKVVRGGECMSEIFSPSFNSIEEAEAYTGPMFEPDKWNSDIVRDEIQFGAPVIDDILKNIEPIVQTCDDCTIVYMLQSFAESTIKFLPNNMPKLENFLSGHNITDVYVMGLSLPGPDDYYFEKLLLPKYINCKWHFYYYGDKDEDAEADRQLKQAYALKHAIKDVDYHRW